MSWTLNKSEKNIRKINNFVPPRELTFAENKVKLWKIERKLSEQARDFDETMDWYASRTPFDEDRREQLANYMTEHSKEIFEFWKKMVALEMDKDIPPTADETLGVMKQNNIRLVERVDSDMKNRIDFSRKAFSEWLVRLFLKWLKTFCINWVMNIGRKVTMDTYENDIYAIQFSAILDDRTSDLCRELDWKVVIKDSPEMQRIEPPTHFNCRSMLVEIMEDEVHKPDFSDYIPAREELEELWRTRTSELWEPGEQMQENIRRAGNER